MGRIDDIVAELRARETQASEHTSPAPRHAQATKKRARATSGERTPPVSSPPRNNKLLSRLVIVLGVLVVLVFVVAPIAERVGAPKRHSATATAPASTASASSSAYATQSVVDPRHGMPQPAEWKSVIEQLDGVRARAIIDGTQIAQEFDDARGPAYAADIALMKSLRTHGYSVASVPLHVASVQENYVTQGDDPRASLTVVDSMDAYEVHGKDGKVVRKVPARSAVTWTVVLTRSPVWGWRYWSVLRATPASK